MANLFATLSVTLMLTLVIAVFYILASRLYSIIYKRMRKTMLRLIAKKRATLLLLLALGAPIVTLISVVTFVLPGFFAFSSPYEHFTESPCHSLIFDYLLSPNVIAVFVTMFALITGFCLIVFAVQQRRLDNNIRHWTTFLCEPKNIDDNFVHTHYSEHPLLISVGIIKPRIIVSSKTRQQLGAIPLTLILVYELIRCKRYDNLRAMICRTFTLFWPNHVRVMFFEDLHCANHAAARQDLESLDRDFLYLPDSINLIGLPSYIHPLLESVSLEQHKSAKSSQTFNPLIFKLFAMHYAFVMITMTSLTHYFVEILL